MVEGSITFSDIESARERIAPFVRRTPLTHSYLLSERVGAQVWLKQENQQHTGSFKPRGALSKILALAPAERARGIVAASAGNHALGVAYACHVLGIERADIFVQANAAPAKLAKLRQYRIGLHLVGKTFEEAQQAALEQVRASGAVYVSAYDDPAVLAGQGTCGLEVLDQLEDFETLIVPVGGGALIAGTALAVKSRRPKVRVVGVNAAASPSALLSLQVGHALDPYDHEPTMAQGLAGGFGKIPFQIARELVDEIVVVSDAEMGRAIATLIDTDQILAEASGIAGLAALLHNRVANIGQNIVVILSGGNLDLESLRQILAGQSGRG